jgi:hypothetical protein
MKNRWLLNLALLALVAALAAVALLKPGQEPETSPLTTLGTEQIRSVRIVRPEQPELRLERHDAGWRLEAPVAARANPYNVDALLRLAGMPVQALAEAGALAEYGLTSPKATVQFNTIDVALGTLHPLDNRVYALRAGRVLLLPGQIYGAALRPWTDYLDTRLLEAERKPIALRLPGFSVTLRDGTWERTPVDKTLSGDRINNFVSNWHHASAISVHRYSKRTPQAWVELRFEDGTTLQLGVLTRQPEFVLYRKDEGLEYRFPEDVGRRLLKLSHE